MQDWFLCTVKYEKTAEDGGLKKVSESYLVSAINFTEAEKRITSELAPYMSGVYEVSDIRRARFSEIFQSTKDEDDKFYKLKISFISLDEKSGKEKRLSQQVLVQAGQLKTAIAHFDDEMKGTTFDYDIVSVAETPIVDLFPFKADE
ncbi:MAG: DUF4494 domain-containing protein [Alloprevotella sp.]|nr:DUF4494 domain-containing protein [Alloprevotella sp.]